MEVKINKEIRQYTESIFFGLSFRQFIFSILACVVAVIIYFIAKQFFEIGIVSWLCMAGAVPFVLLGFVKYNGMPAEKFFSTWIKSEILTPKRLTFKPNNYYLNACKEAQRRKKTEKRKNKKQKILRIFNFVKVFKPRKIKRKK